MPDSTWQGYALCRQGDALLSRYERCPNIFIGINLMLRYRDGADTRALVPDVFVVFGVPAKGRPSYEVWKEGKVPDFVLEVASQGTYGKDLGSKKDTYEELGVPELCVFDPQGGMHRPRLQLFRLEDGVYEPVSGRSGADGSLAVTSETLGLELRLEDDRLRLWDPESREYLLDRNEERARYEAERARYEAERARCEAARARCEEERAGRLKERDIRIATEQRVRDLESQLADLKERRPDQH